MLLKEYSYSYLKAMNYKPIKEDGYLYAKGSVPVLLVAHLDTVHDKLPRNIKYVDGKVSDANGIGGDDRCGVYMILKIVRELRCSVLFTEDEETGCVGASKFCKSPYIKQLDVNYIIELDRRGKNDAVFYDCDNPEFTKFCTDSEIGFKESWGSFTDISTICEYCEIAGVNFSCGYYNAHTKQEYVVLSEMEDNIKRVKRLIKKPVDKPFKYIRSQRDYSYGYGYYGYYGSCWKSQNRVTAETGAIMMRFIYEDCVSGIYDSAVTSGESRAECFYKFFKENPNVCYNDIYDWAVL